MTDIQLSNVKETLHTNNDDLENKNSMQNNQTPDVAQGTISLCIDNKPKKKPRRILHFSDGSLEEYSTDEETDSPPKEEAKQQLVDIHSYAWKPWLWYWVAYSGSSALTFCDYVGESLANFFGITAPKYQYEIEEYHRTVAEEELEKQKEDLENAGWTKNTDTEKLPDASTKSYQSISSAVANLNQKNDGFTNIAELQPEIVITNTNETERY